MSLPLYSVRSWLTKNAPSKQIELGASVHLAFEQFESVDLPFDLTLAPWELESGSNGRIVPPEAFCEPAQLWDPTGLRAGDPSVKGIAATLAQEVKETLDRGGHGRNERASVE